MKILLVIIRTKGSLLLSEHNSGGDNYSAFSQEMSRIVCDAVGYRYIAGVFTYLLQYCLLRDKNKSMRALVGHSTVFTEHNTKAFQTALSQRLPVSSAQTMVKGH